MARLITTTEYLNAAFAAMEEPAHEEQPTADVRVWDHGSIVLLRPLTNLAEDWIADNIQDDAQWFGGSLACERRYAPYVIEGMISGGLQFAGEAY